MTRGTKRPTPYDKKIAELRGRRSYLDSYEVEVLRAFLLKQEGYLAAVADHADLLAALQRCSQLFRKIRDDFEDPRHECREGIRIIEAAIAKAKEGQP